MSTTEAQFLQDQVDQLSTQLANAEQVNTALMQTLTEGGGIRDLIDANSAASAVPADGEEIDTGRTFGGRKVFARGVSQASVGGVTNDGKPTVLFDDVYQVTKFAVILHIVGPDGMSIEVPNTYIDVQTDVIGVYAEHKNMNNVSIIDQSATENLRNWWGTIEYTKASAP